MSAVFAISPIAIARTPYQGKFGIPRQSGLVDVPATIDMLDPYNDIEAFAGLEQVSHIWITFVFSENIEQKSRLKVRPPRLGGNKKMGVFATRSSFRPNALGQSLVKLTRIEVQDRQVRLHVTGIDVLDGTPVVDIKPYLPYADIAESATNTLAASAPDARRLIVSWHTTALNELQYRHQEKAAHLQEWISDIIALDPRPAYQSTVQKIDYAMTVFNMNVCWQMVDDHHAEITTIDMLRG